MRVYPWFPMKDAPSSKATKRSLRVVVLIALVVGGFYALLPFALQKGTLALIRASGAQNVHLKSVKFNPFTTRLTIEGLRFTTPNKTATTLQRLTLNIDLDRPFQKELFLKRGTLHGLTLYIPAPKKNAPPKKEQTHGKKGWRLTGIGHFTLFDAQITYAHDKAHPTHLHIKQLDLTSPKNQDARLELQGEINQSPLVLSLDISLKEPSLTAITEISGGVQLQKLDLKAFRHFAAPYGAELQGKMDIDTRISILRNHNGGFSFNHTGLLEAHGLKGRAKEWHLENLSLSWLGEVEMLFSPQKTLIQVKTLSRLETQDLRLAYPKTELRLAHQNLNWDGRFDWKKEDSASPEAQGDLTLTSGTLLQKETQVALLEKLTGFDVRFKGWNSLHCPHIYGENLALFPPVIHLGRLDITGVAAQPFSQHYSVETLIAKKTGLSLEKNSSGQFQKLMETASIIDLWNNGKKNSKKRPPLTCQIKTLRLSDSPLIRLTDHSVTPTFKRMLTVKQFQINDVDSNQPQKESSFSLTAHLGPYETLEAKGALRPLLPDFTGRWASKIRNLDLATFSPYTSSKWGYHIRTGALSVDSEVEIHKGTLKGNNHLTLTQFDLIPDDKDKVARTIKDLAIPIDMAVSVLKDKNGIIELDVPIQGDLTNPDVNLQSIYRKATAKAITTGAISYLKYLFQPYGTFISVAQTVGDYATRIYLDPVGFSPGSISPNAQGLDYLSVVAKIMKEKETLNLTVCANATQEDLLLLEAERFKPALTAPNKKGHPSAARKTSDPHLFIARKRAEAIRTHLVNLGIDATRIHLCHPNFDVSDEESPKARLGF